MKSGSSRVGTRLAASPTRDLRIFAMSIMEIEVAGDGEEAFASRGRVGHGAEVEVG